MQLHQNTTTLSFTDNWLKKTALFGGLFQPRTCLIILIFWGQVNKGQPLGFVVKVFTRWMPFLSGDIEF